MAQLSIVKTEPISAPLSIVSQDPIAAPKASNPVPIDSRNSIQKSFDTNTKTSPTEPLLETGLKSVVGAVGSPLMHPLDALSGMGHMIAHPIDTAHQEVNQLYDDKASGGTGYAATKFGGNLLGSIALGEAGGEIAGSALRPLGTVVRDAARGDADAAALRGLQLGPKSPKALGTIQSVQGARPFLQGAKSLEDLQSRIQPAKEEIWSPYKQAVDAIGDRPVKGPDGITTVRDLEDQRAQLSALNRGLKSGSPEAIQLAQQKGMTAAQLLDQEKAVHAALDPELGSTGIDPKAIRQTFGNVAQVNGKISGKSTLIEKPQPYGLGKFVGSIGSFDATHPISSLLKPFQAGVDGLGDITAGRPIWSGKPTDVAIKDAFAKSGPKPNFGKFQMPTNKGLLQAPGIDEPASPYEFGTPVRTSITPDAPTSFPRLPATASEGDLKPMIWPKANAYPGLAEDFASTRIVPSRSKIPSTTLPSETNGLMLGAGERLGLPADVGEQNIDPRFLQKRDYPALNAATAIEKPPVVFSPKRPGMLNGLFTAGEDGQIIPERKGLPAPKPKTLKGRK